MKICIFMDQVTTFKYCRIAETFLQKFRIVLECANYVPNWSSCTRARSSPLLWCMTFWKYLVLRGDSYMSSKCVLWILMEMWSNPDGTSCIWRWRSLTSNLEGIMKDKLWCWKHASTPSKFFSRWTTNKIKLHKVLLKELKVIGNQGAVAFSPFLVFGKGVK